MKKIVLGLLAVAFLFLFGCAVPGADSGSVLLKIPASAELSRAAFDGLTNPSPVYEKARIRILSGSSFFTFDSGEDYIDVDSNGAALSIEGLNPGTNYIVSASFGTVDPTTNTLYNVVAFGESESFSLSSGETKNISIALYGQNGAIVSTVQHDFDISSAVVVGSTVYSESGGTVYEDGVALTLSFTGVSPAPAVTSISLGEDASENPQLWINTDRGIFPYDAASGLDMAFGADYRTTYTASASISSSEMITLDMEEYETAINDAVVAFNSTTPAPSELKEQVDLPDTVKIILFEGEDLLVGGAYVEDMTDPSSWVWFSSTEYIGDINDSTSPLYALKDVLGNTDYLMNDFVLTDEFAIVVTPLGTFFVSTGDVPTFMDLMDDPSSLDINTLLGALNAITVVPSGTSDINLMVQCLDYVEGTSTGSLYLGTAANVNKRYNGVYEYSVDMTSGVISGLGVVTGTEGEMVYDIVSMGVDSTNNQRHAVLTDGAILIMEDSQITHTLREESSGLPFGIQNLFYADGKLYVSGTSGLAFVDLSKL